MKWNNAGTDSEGSTVKVEEGLSFIIMVNTLEFANDLPIHKEESWAEDRCSLPPSPFSHLCLLILAAGQMLNEKQGWRRTQREPQCKLIHRKAYSSPNAEVYSQFFFWKKNNNILISLFAGHFNTPEFYVHNILCSKGWMLQELDWALMVPGLNILWASIPGSYAPGLNQILFF